MEIQKDDLVQLGIAKLSQLHPSTKLKRLRAVLGDKLFFAIARDQSQLPSNGEKYE